MSEEFERPVENMDGPADGSAADDIRHGPQEPPGAPTGPYEPPRLIRMGNLRDLLGKSGNQFDFTTHRPQKP